MTFEVILIQIKYLRIQYVSIHTIFFIEIGSKTNVLGRNFLYSRKERRKDGNTEFFSDI